MRHVVYNANSELASFVLDGFRDPGTVLIAYPEMPRGPMGKIGRGIESIFSRLRLGLYPDAATRRKLRAIEPTDVVLFFAMENINNIASVKKYVRAHAVHVFLWNPVAKLRKSADKGEGQIARLKSICERIHTFDQDDARAHGLAYAPQPYRAVADAASAAVRHGFFFSGVDKGRLGVLLELKAAIEHIGMRHLFHIVGDEGRPYTADQRTHLQDSWITYGQNLVESQAADCLVEIIQEAQSGPTLRSMEALFLGKKIITNRISARDDAFYDPDRVLVIERIDPAVIADFMRRPFKSIAPAFRAPHEIHAWIEKVAPPPQACAAAASPARH